MRRLTKRLVSVCFAMLLGTGMVGGLSESVAANNEKPEIWKFATIAPKGIGLGNSIRNIVIPAIEEGSDHTLKIDVYWGGVMGDEADYQQKMRLGQIQGTGISGMAATIFCPEMSVLELPFMFNSWAEVDYIKKVMREDFEKLHEKYGYMLAAWNDQGFDQFYSNKWRLDKLEQFENAKFGSWYGEVEVKFLETLGANPIPVSVAEAVPAIRQKVADSMVGPSFYIVATQMYPNVKYVNPINVRYSPAVIVIDLDRWNGVKDKYKQRYKDQRFDIEAKIAKNLRSDSDKCLAAIIKYGAEECHMAPEEVKIMKEKARTTWDYFTGKFYSRELLDKLLGHLATFREGQEK